MNDAILDLIALAPPVLAAICAVRYWRGTIRFVVGIAIVSLPFTPAWDAAWTLLTQSWHGEQAMAEPEVLAVGIKRLSAADLGPDIRGETDRSLLSH
jgi:hypothetical protein